MKKNNIIKSLSLLIVVVLITTGCGKEIEVKNGSKVAVSTNKEKITATEYYDAIKENNISTLIDMIDKGFLEKKYKSDSEEKKKIDEQIEQIRSYYGSDETTYKNTLRSYFGVETEEELEEKLKLEYKRTKAVEDYIISKITDKEIQTYYDEKITGQVKASHILISVDAKEEDKEKAEEKALKKAKEIIEKLNKGEKFATLAKKNSDDKATAVNGGDLGYFDLDDMVSEFKEAVKNLEKNEYTKEPVKTQYGYHIILKTGEKDKEKLDKVKDNIKENIKEEKLNSDSTVYYKSLMKVREKYKLTWNDSKLKKAYNDYMDKLIESASSNNQ